MTLSRHRLSAILIGLCLLFAAACGRNTGNTVPVDNDTPTTSVSPDGSVISYSGANHSFGTYHAGPYEIAGVKYDDHRIVLVYDRTTDEQSSLGMRDFIGHMVTAANTYPALPYLYYVDDRANAGQCGVGAGGISAAQGRTSIILACNGSPTGNFGQSYWSVESGSKHLLGEANAWLTAGVDRGYAYTGWCHELGHIINFPGHATETASCMYSPINLSSSADKYKGYTSNDFTELVQNYYSHYPA